MNKGKTRQNNLKNDLFIRACYRQDVERTPVWMMRQAGRYLPQYRAIREKYDFTTMYKTPEIATEVTLQPVDFLKVDAAILFSDILVVPEAMGMSLEFFEGKGPLFSQPIRDKKQVDQLRPIVPEEDLYFVLEAIKMIRKELNGRVPLIGFSGAPWTLAAYMVEGGKSRNFTYIKNLRYSNPELLSKLLEKITEAVILYLKAQIRAGVQAVQLFDTWVGLLDPQGFEQFALKYARRVFESLKNMGIPLIYFAKGAGIWLEKLKECQADVLGLDWTVDIGWARNRVGDQFALQGNLDPTVLLSSPKIIRQEIVKILTNFGKANGHIFNLGHGILPNVTPENAKVFIQAVKEESVRFH